MPKKQKPKESDWEVVRPITDRKAAVGDVMVETRPLTDPLTTRRMLRASGQGGGRTASFGSASMLDFGVGSSGLPSVLASNSPISTMLYTLSRADRLNLFRYWTKTDSFVARAIDLHTELPLSRMSIGSPKGPNHRQNREINRIYEHMTERVGLSELLLQMSREMFVTGEVYVWFDWDEEMLEWSDIYIIPTEFCHSILHPFNRRKELIFFARPLVDTTAIRRMTDRDMYLIAEHDVEQLFQQIGEDIPDELKEALQYGEAVRLNTDWKKGSFCAHLQRQPNANEPYGSSIIERCVETLFRLENLKNAQIQISGRNMQPKHLIWAEAIGPDQLQDLRNQVDLSLLEQADFPIVTNYPVTWQTIGANDRLLAVDAEYATLLDSLAVGLGTTRDLLTGQATYGGQRITVELMNTQYLQFRDIIKRFVENFVFRPVAEAKGHYYREEIETWVRVEADDIEVGDEIIQEHDGTLRRKMVQINKIYNHSTVRFNRLSIRDNTEVYDQLFQLYQKGSLASRYLLDLHNIDPDENAVALLEDLGTVKDSSFNDLIRAMYAELSPIIVQTTDLSERVIEALNLEKRKVPLPPTGGMGMGAPLGGGLGMGMGGTPTLGGDLTGMAALPQPNELGGMDQLGPGGGMSGQGMEVTPDVSMDSAGTPLTASKKRSGRKRLPGKKLSEEVIYALREASRTSAGKLSPLRMKKIAKQFEKVGR